jgi:hypothetical protein
MDAIRGLVLPDRDSWIAVQLKGICNPKTALPTRRAEQALELRSSVRIFRLACSNCGYKHNFRKAGGRLIGNK